jgi:hypothetical protein
MARGMATPGSYLFLHYLRGCKAGQRTERIQTVKQSVNIDDVGFADGRKLANGLLAEGEELGSNGLLIWSARTSTRESD